MPSPIVRFPSPGAATGDGGIAERFMRGRGQKDTTALIEPLEKVTLTTDNQNLADRAKSLLRRAKNQGQ